MSDEPKGQSKEANEGSPPKPRPAIIRILRALKRYENRRRCSKTQHQLNEQMMARWTRHVGWLTGALVLVSIITAFIFWKQLSVMQGQLNQMKSASAQTARATRPYLLFEPVTITFSPTPEQFSGIQAAPGMPVQNLFTNGTRPFLALYKFTNYGTTPAIVFKEAFDIEYPELFQWSFMQFINTDFRQGYVIGAQKSTNDFRGRQQIGTKNWTTMINGPSRFFFAAFITYQDVFGNPYETRVCFQVDVPFGSLTSYESGPNCTNKRT